MTKPPLQTSRVWTLFGVVDTLRNYTWILFVWIISTEVAFVLSGSQRYEDQSFPAHAQILGQNVTCGQFTPGRFVAPTYTCADLRVNGHRLAYGYYSGWAVGQEDQRCQETSGVHEFPKLCQLLLKAIHVEHLGFKAVYVPKSTCAYLNETRKLLKKVSSTQFVWKDFKSGWGWTKTIQCMTDLVKVH